MNSRARGLLQQINSDLAGEAEQSDGNDHGYFEDRADAWMDMLDLSPNELPRSVVKAVCALLLLEDKGGWGNEDHGDIVLAIDWEVALDKFRHARHGAD